MRKKSPPSPSVQSRRYHGHLVTGLLCAAVFASLYGSGGNAQLIGGDWFLRTLMPFARQTLSPDKFAEFLRAVGGADQASSSSQGISSAPAVARPPVAASSAEASQPIPPVPPVSQESLPQDGKTCEFDAPRPLCPPGSIPHFLRETCVKAGNTGWMYVCNEMGGSPSRLSSCGNGVVDRGEDCDDANDNNADGCSFCRHSVCGDGRKDPGECGEFAAGLCSPGQSCAQFLFYCGLDCDQ